MRHPRKRKAPSKAAPSKLAKLPTGYLFNGCGCCGKRLGGSTTDPLAVCKRCATKGCNLRLPKDIAVKCGG